MNVKCKFHNTIPIPPPKKTKKKPKKRFLLFFWVVCFDVYRCLISGECPNLSNRKCLNFLAYDLNIVGGELELCDEGLSERRLFLKVIKKNPSVIFDCPLFKYEPCRTSVRNSRCDRIIHECVYR